MIEGRVVISAEDSMMGCHDGLHENPYSGEEEAVKKSSEDLIYRFRCDWRIACK
jgi:hypothetical protein